MKAKKGIALIIANADYKNFQKLPSCRKDGNDMKQVLEELNFDTIYGKNLTRKEMLQHISVLLKESDLYSTILVYYSGHGTQIDGENYFVPIDCKLQANKKLLIASELINLDTITEYTKTHTKKISIIILDACRTNPGFDKDLVGEGLADIDAGTGSIVAFATAPNTSALCSCDPLCNSYYTHCLLHNIKKPNTKIEDMFKLVRKEVLIITNNQQNPWENTSLKTDFYFNTMDEDEINETIYQCIRNKYDANSLIKLSEYFQLSITDIMRKYNKQKSEKVGGIYFSNSEELEEYILHEILELGFTFSNYRWMFNGQVVLMGDFLHNPSFQE